VTPADTAVDTPTPTEDLGIDQVIEEAFGGDGGEQDVAAFQQSGDDACVTVTPATSVPTTGPISVLPGTGNGGPGPASPTGIFLLIGGATLLAAGVLLTMRKPSGDS
jgi:hypothetical protein